MDNQQQLGQPNHSPPQTNALFNQYQQYRQLQQQQFYHEHEQIDEYLAQNMEALGAPQYYHVAAHANPPQVNNINSNVGELALNQSQHVETCESPFVTINRQLGIEEDGDTSYDDATEHVSNRILPVSLSLSIPTPQPLDFSLEAFTKRPFGVSAAALDGSGNQKGCNKRARPSNEAVGFVRFLGISQLSLPPPHATSSTKYLLQSPKERAKLIGTLESASGCNVPVSNQQAVLSHHAKSMLQGPPKQRTLLAYDDLDLPEVNEMFNQENQNRIGMFTTGLNHSVSKSLQQPGSSHHQFGKSTMIQVQNDSFIHGSLLAQARMYEELIGKRNLSPLDIQLKDYYAAGAECPTLKDMYAKQGLVETPPGNGKLEWMLKNKVKDTNVCLHDQTNSSSHLGNGIWRSIDDVKKYKLELEKPMNRI